MTTFHSHVHLFENTLETGNGWLVLELEGDPARGVNRDAVGAQVVARTSEGRVIWRTVASGEGYLARGSLEVEIGLGTATSVDLEILWPGGERDVHPGIEPNRAIRISQGKAEIESLWED